VVAHINATFLVKPSEHITVIYRILAARHSIHVLETFQNIKGTKFTANRISNSMSLLNTKQNIGQHKALLTTELVEESVTKVDTTTVHAG
jgi:hypothetical protein